MAKVVFFRTDTYNNSECIRKIPYEGKSYWPVKAIHKKRFERYIKYAKPNHVFYYIELPEDSLYKVKALNFDKVNKYVTGASKTIPKIEEFDHKKHCTTFDFHPLVKTGQFSKNELEYLGFSAYEPQYKFQVLITE
jgi:hypothetical protein